MDIQHHIFKFVSWHSDGLLIQKRERLNVIKTLKLIQMLIRIVLNAVWFVPKCVYMTKKNKLTTTAESIPGLLFHQINFNYDLKTIIFQSKERQQRLHDTVLKM